MLFTKLKIRNQFPDLKLIVPDNLNRYQTSDGVHLREESKPDYERFLEFALQ